MAPLSLLFRVSLALIATGAAIVAVSLTIAALAEWIDGKLA